MLPDEIRNKLIKGGPRQSAWGSPIWDELSFTDYKDGDENKDNFFGVVGYEGGVIVSYPLLSDAQMDRFVEFVCDDSPLFYEVRIEKVED